ncbi:MAG: OmpA family protein, partial [Verrucomicrobiota bacterium]
IPNAENIGLGSQKIDLELLKDPNLGWSVSSIGAPDLNAVAANPSAPNTNSAPNNPNTAEPAPEAAGNLDAAGVAKSFLAAVIARNFQNAKKHVQSDKLSDERLAALFIVIDEGKFTPHPETPLIPTVNQDMVSWFIAKLVSESRQSEFGLEMNRADANADWKIVSLNFDQLMQKVASAAGAGDVAYTNIRTDLRGGESLVLFFGFDDDSVNPRAARQLQIIADILKQDEKRTLSINGHADARGEEDYNERLSNSRASRVRRALLSMGVPPGQLITKAFGESAPKAPNFNPDGTDNSSGQAQNRRAEVYLDF